MNRLTRALAVAFAAAGLTLAAAPLAGAATTPTAATAVAPAHWGHHWHHWHHWGHEGWAYGEQCINYYDDGVWYQDCD